MGFQTGDIICRQNAGSSLTGRPFGYLVQWLTKSKYSHCSVVLVEDGKVYAMQVDDDGTTKMPIEKWYEICDNGTFGLYRVKSFDVDALTREINKFLELDPAYDYTFGDEEDKFYCTESVVYVFSQAGTELGTGMYAKDIVSPLVYAFLVPADLALKCAIGKYFSLTVPLYFVGNKKIGLLSSPLIDEIGEYKCFCEVP